MSTIRNKQRLLHLYRFLQENTDEDHQATTNDLVAFLKREDANASRKTVKDDIEVLIEEGIDIVMTKSYYNSYFIGNRIFELSEVKYLADMIASSRSLTNEKKEKLIGKLLSTVSIHQAEKMREMISYSKDRIDSEQLYYNTYVIMDAIRKGKKIEFLYYDYSPTGERVLRHNGEIYICSPYGTACSDNRYYMVGYSDKHEHIVCFRIDSMLRASIIENEPAVKMPDDFALDKYIDSLFDMQVGEEQEIVMECCNDMMRVIIDTFGSRMETWKSTVDSFYVKTHVNVSPSFWGWLVKYEGKIRIISPVSVLNQYQDCIRSILRGWKKK